MTPPAATPAGARATDGRSRASKAKAGTARKTPHARTVRRSSAPKAPRRVSGPVRSNGATLPRRAAPGRATPRPRPSIRIPGIRLPAGRSRSAPLQQRAAAWIRALPDHPLLDRIVRGRTWIVLLGVLLSGIVATQVEMLKLNGSIGRSIELGTALQSRNELLRASVSSLSDEQRIERLATKMGMVMPGPTAAGFLDAGKVNAGQAAANIHAPDPSGFESLLAASNSAEVTPLGSGQNGSLTASPTESTPGGTTATATQSTSAADGPSATATGATAATTGATGAAATGTSSATAPADTTAPATTVGGVSPGTEATGSSGGSSGATGGVTGAGTEGTAATPAP